MLSSFLLFYLSLTHLVSSHLLDACEHSAQKESYIKASSIFGIVEGDGQYKFVLKYDCLKHIFCASYFILYVVVVVHPHPCFCFYCLLHVCGIGAS